MVAVTIPKTAAREKAVVLWSGGKDCTLALHDVRDDFEIAALITTVTAGYDRISMHGVRVSLLEKQAAALGITLEKVVVSPTCSNDEYEAKMRAALARFRSVGVTSAICGDLFLEDVRRYREERLFSHGMRGVFPLWNQPTSELAARFIQLGYQAVLCCVDTTVLDQEFAGRYFDDKILAELPPRVDPCGENGEFHTFVFDGPLLANRIELRIGERVLRDNRFGYCDLVDDGGA
jgi:uncharacterized protein (TIGR00290 family)